MSRSLAHAVLLTGLVLVSTSGPFFEMTHLPALAVVLHRLTGAAALFLLWAWLRRSCGRPRPS